MVSGEDIEAWREDEKQTQFLEEQRRLADNHVGWGVEALYDTGWALCSPIFSTRKEALTTLAMHSAFWLAWEFRVNEVVKEKK
jgi:hypothetical protein